MRAIELISDRNTSSKLTLTPSRIVIRFQAGLSEESKHIIKEFFLLIADRLENHPHSLRGVLFKDGTIVMTRENGAKIERFSMT